MEYPEFPENWGNQDRKAWTLARAEHIGIRGETLTLRCPIKDRIPPNAITRSLVIAPTWSLGRSSCKPLHGTSATMTLLPTLPRNGRSCRLLMARAEHIGLRVETLTLRHYTLNRPWCTSARSLTLTATLWNEWHHVSILSDQAGTPRSYVYHKGSLQN